MRHTQSKWRAAYNPVQTICGQNHFSRPKRAVRPKLQCGFMSSKYGTFHEKIIFLHLRKKVSVKRFHVF
jgi:hypothetical protein